MQGLYTDSGGVTTTTPVAAFAVQYALFCMWCAWGVTPSILMGLGVGEYVAACASGLLSLADSLELVASNGSLSGRTLSVPRIALVSASSGQLVTSTSDSLVIGDSSADFSAALGTMQSLGAKIYLEMAAESSTTPKIMWTMLFEEASAANATWQYSYGDVDPKMNGWKAVLQTLSELFVRGVPVDWQAFDSHHRPVQSKNLNYVLPTYPFQYDRYWLGVDSGAAELQTRALAHTVSEPLSILLGQKVSSPFISETVFVSHMSMATPLLGPVLADHVISTLCIVPAVFQVGMALEAAININGRNGQALEDVVIPAALLLKESTTRTVQLVMSPEQDGVQAFALCSFEKGDETDPSAWTEHASGKMIAAGPEAAQLTSEKPETIQQRCSMQISKPDFYEFMFAREYELQTHFQLVEHIWRNPDRSKGTTDNMEVVCKLFNDNGPHTRGYTLYPVFFDCCIQIIMSMVAWDIAPEDFTSYVPLGMQRFNLYGRSAGQDLWCHTKLHDGQDLLSDVLVADLRLINTEGDVIAEALNFRVKKAGRELLMQSVQEDLSDWYYEMQWTEKKRCRRSGHL
jgi:acyl transferase domain-containing protein